MAEDDGQSPSAPMFSRAEIERGLPARRASGVLFAIEALTARLVANQRISRAAFVGERTSTEREEAFLQAMAVGRDLPLQPTIQDLERFAPRWAELVPDGVEARAAVAVLMASKYRLVRDRVPRIRAALGLDDAPVGGAVARQLGTARTLYVPAPTWRDALAWRRAAFTQRIETMPTFWVAFALALTETITEGILVVPVAVAGIGPLAGVVVLVALGIVNLITLAAMVEAITRNGSMRYGTAYLGRLVSDLLGRPTSISLSAALGIFNAVVLLVYMLGFGSVLRGATGISEEVWVALLFAVNVWILRRGQLDETVATAVIIGAVNVTLILAITGIALANVEPQHLAYRNVPFLDGGGLDPVILQLVFGVIIVSYFGHTSAANASKLILGRDPTGRSLLWGNLAALATAIGLYSLIVVAFNGAVGPEPLIETRGTAVTPLADRAGPLVDVLGSLYVILAVGLGSLYCSLGLYNQVIEYLPAPSSRSNPGLAGGLAGGRGRLLAGLAPLIVTFLALEYLLLTDQDWFARPIAVIGVLTVPLIGGIFPMLLVMAARRRGEYVPRTVIGIVGHPITVGAVSAVFLIGVFLHALVIWTDPIERVAALVVGVGTSALIALVLAGPAFRRTVVLELRGAAEGAPMRPDLTLTVGGKPARAEVILEHRDASDRVSGAEPVDLATLSRATIAFVPNRTRRLKVWVHTVSAGGESTAVPATVHLDDGKQRRVLPLDRFGSAGAALDGAPATVVVEFPSAVNRSRQWEATAG